MAERLATNTEIRAKEVRLIGPEGKQVGIVPLKIAIDAARALDLDLVEVAPNASPPVAKVMAYGKHLYEQERAEREAGAGSSVPGVLSAQTKAQVEHLERSSSSGSSSVADVLSGQARAQTAYLEQLAAQQEAASTGAGTGSSSSDDDDVSAPLVVLALLGGGPITGAATTYTPRRIRHDGPGSTATA